MASASTRRAPADRVWPYARSAACGFSTAGIATIAKGSKSVKVNPAVAIGNSSKVLCTLQSNAGGATTVHRVQKDTAADRFTIYLTANATAATKVAWFLID